MSSAPPTGLHFLMCDGSVHAIAYEIDMPTYQRLGTRAKGDVIDQVTF